MHFYIVPLNGLNRLLPRILREGIYLDLPAVLVPNQVYLMH
nr:MAG TPA: hypothetical protein [Caudoviricetes sp.]